MGASLHSLDYERRFVGVVLWICAAAALWLLLSPAAFERRALTRRMAALQEDVQRLKKLGAGLERWRDGLETDRSAIEREARKLGYGRPGERLYLLSQHELNRERSRLAAQQPRNIVRWEELRGPLGSALMLIIGCLLAALFFADLKVEDPYEQPGMGPKTSAPQGADRVARNPT